MRTIMAYGVGPRLGYFSNPNINVWGSPTGNTNSANNAWTIQQTAPMVGNYFTQIIQAKKLITNAVSQSAIPINRAIVRGPVGGFNGN